MPSVQSNFRVRKNLGRVRRIVDVPEPDRHPEASYDKFLQMNVPPNEREDIGLQGVFSSVFPIKDFNGTSELVFVSYNLEKPKYDVDECRQRGMTFAAPIKVTIQLMVYDTRDGGERIVRDIKEQEVYFGEIPLMTETGTFIINGTERVVVSQLHRSPGVFFDHDKGKTHSSGKLLYSARVIPYRGSWLDFEFDHKDIIYVRIDRRRKMHATVLLRALGYSTQELLNYFYATETIYIEKGEEVREERRLRAARRPARDARHQDRRRSHRQEEHQVHARRDPQAQGGEARAPGRRARGARRQGGRARRRRLGDGRGPPRVQRGADRGQARRLREAGIESFKVLFIDGLNVGPYLRDTLLADKVQDDGRGDHGDLPPPAPGRSADARDGEDAVPEPVLQPRALRPVEGRPPEAELQVLPRRARRAAPDARRSRCSRRRTSSRRSAT